VFDKEHKNVLRDIREAIETIDRFDKDSKNIDNLKSEGIYFIENVYRDKQNRTKPEYLLAKDGFTLVVN